MRIFTNFLYNQRLTVGILLILSIGSPSFVFGQKYNFRIFSIEEGLPQASVLSLYSDNKGLIHVGTQGGYSTFDGRTFQTIDQKSGLNNNHVTTIHQMEDDVFWIGHRYEAPTMVTKDSIYTIKGGLADSIGSVTHTIATVNNHMWFGTQDDGLFRFDMETTKLSRVSLPLSRESMSINKLVVDHQKNLYLASNKGMFVLEKDEFRRLDLTKLHLRSHNIVAMNYYSDGSFVVMTPYEIVRLFVVSGKVTGYVVLYSRTPADAETWSDFIVTRKEEIWIATEHGAIQVSKGVRKLFSVKNGLGQGTVSAIMEDREGNIWIGLFGQGLYQYLGSDFKQIDASLGLAGNTVQGITIYKNDVWVATEEGVSRLIYEDDDLNVLLSIKNYTKAHGLIDNDVYAIVTGPNGDIWMSSMNGIVRYAYESNQVIAYPSIKWGLPSFLITMDVDKEGRIWLGSLSDGCARITLDQRLTIQNVDRYTPENGLVSRQIWKVLCDSQGRIWIGSNDNGLNLFENEVFTTVQDLPTKRPASLTEDIYGDLWIGSIGDGIFRYDGKNFTNYTSAQGISSDNPYFVSSDAVGNIWIGTNKGVDRLNIHRGEITSFGKNEGFKGVETNQNAFFRDKNGNMWFGTIQGVVHCYPSEIKTSEVPPLVFLSGLRIFLVPRKLAFTNRLNYNENYITFDFTGVHYTSPLDVLFSFKLEGFNEQWSPLSTENAATYSNLPPGEYRFLVRARNRDGIWSESAAHTFVVLPPFWLTWWFKSITILLVFCSIYLVFYVRTRSLVRQGKLLKDKVDQRTEELWVEKSKVEEFNDKLSSQNVLLEMKNKDITDSIRYAERIQNGMLPGLNEIEKIVPDHVLFFKPRDIVSGDFYWCRAVSGVRYFAAIDCTGHGVPGAFMSLIGNDLLNQTVHETVVKDTGVILTDMHQKLRSYFAKEGIDDGMDMAICALYPDGKLQFSGAKRPLFIVRKGEVITHKGDRFSIGDTSNDVVFETESIELELDDMIYIFSDGFPDQFGGDDSNGGKKYMIRRFRELLVRIASLTFEEQYMELERELNLWKGNLEQVDDVLVWGVRFV